MTKPDTTSDVITAPRPAVRWIVSCLVLFHITAVFVGPWAMPPATSELAGSVAGWLRPYIEYLSLANGYRFFAPEPGPSHLVRYEVTLPDGSHKEGVFPDRQQHRPRLMYHRHFMMSEFVNTLEGPGPNERSQAFARSYAEHLAHEFDADSVKLFLRRHYVPRMSEARQGMKLNDKALYDEHPLYTLSKEALP